MRALDALTVGGVTVGGEARGNLYKTCFRLRSEWLPAVYPENVAVNEQIRQEALVVTLRSNLTSG